MFKDNKETKNSAETVIGPSIKVKGNFYGEGDMIIEGVVEGDIKTDNFLLASKNSKITANIKAKNAKIGGVVNGNLNIDTYLEILSSAVINGDVKASQISIEKGAIFNGKCTMNNNTQTNQGDK